MSYDDNGYWDEEQAELIDEPLLREPSWFGNEIVVEDAYGELHSYTLEEWHEILLMDGQDFDYFFGYDHLDLIYELEAAGLWDDEDWEEWREDYNAIHG